MHEFSHYTLNDIFRICLNTFTILHSSLTCMFNRCSLALSRETFLPPLPSSFSIMKDVGSMCLGLDTAVVCVDINNTSSWASKGTYNLRILKFGMCHWRDKWHFTVTMRCAYVCTWCTSFARCARCVTFHCLCFSLNVPTYCNIHWHTQKDLMA